MINNIINNIIEITDVEFIQLAALIKSHCGISLKDEKKSLVNGRLQKLLNALGFESFSQYYQYLLLDKNGSGIIELVNSITTNHTFFMREPAHFDILKKIIMPYLKDSVTDNDIRVWCAASSTGEEPYTLAMIMDEFFMGNKLWNTKILATDISTCVLDTAKEGVYKKTSIAVLPRQWIQSYFIPFDKENMRVNEKIRKEVIYRRFNLIQELFPFKRKFHVIFCRNVLIYFDDQTQQRLIDKFYNNLEYGGYLFIGHTEAICYEQDKFEYVAPSVYRKI